MECNKDEAVRAKEIAERKVKEKDYAGAKKFASKAQTLYPGLEGLDQMLTTIAVYISAENKVSGQVDWYKVLDVSPWADDETIKKQYRKLALLLHPDKNKSVGADGAFNLVSEAWSLLSDKARRLAYNQRINSSGLQQKFPTQSGLSSVPPRANGSHNSSNNVASNARTHGSHNWMGPTSVTPPPDKRPPTFWTLCNKCKTQFEYLRIYLNHTLLCPSCKQPFLAVEKAPPPVPVASNWSSHQQQQNSGRHAANSNSFNYGNNSSFAQNTGHGGLAGHSSSNKTSFQWGSYSRTSGVNSTVGSTSVAAEAAHVIQQAQEKVKREREEAQAAAGWGGSNVSYRMGNSNLKRRKDDIRYYGNVGGVATQMATGSGPALGVVSDSRRNILETQNTYGFSGIYQKPKSERELLSFELRNMLVDKARIEIRQKLHEWRSVAEAKNAEKEREKAREVERDSKRNKGLVNGNMHGGVAVTNQGKKSPLNSSPDDLEAEAPALMSINVPDSDFHNFDLDRTEVSFADDQVWAAYDEDDGMPRYYARIHKVISLKPFKMKISWLNSRSNNELGPLDWIGSGFSKTCGEFRAGKHEISETLNFFSHKVHWTKGMRGVIQIYPRKGDVWALYKNWSPDWNENTPKDVIHKYDMVEVLDDFNEEQGVSVTPLIKVGGFRTVFRRNEDPKETRRIKKAEIFCLSHQVPNYLLTGQEAPNSLAGCRELDPAATPLELLQVINEASEAPGAANSQKTEEAVSQCASKIEVYDIAGDLSRARGEMIEDCKAAKDGHSTALAREA